MSTGIQFIREQRERRAREAAVEAEKEAGERERGAQYAAARERGLAQLDALMDVLEAATRQLRRK